MKNQLKALLKGMKEQGFEWSFVIPQEEVTYVQKTLNLKGKTDEELYDLWNTIDNEFDEMIKDCDKELKNLIHDYSMTILTIINGSKTFNYGINY